MPPGRSHSEQPQAAALAAAAAAVAAAVAAAAYLEHFWRDRAELPLNFPP